jgi:hypothetical protein
MKRMFVALGIFAALAQPALAEIKSIDLSDGRVDPAGMMMLKGKPCLVEHDSASPHAQWVDWFYPDGTLVEFLVVPAPSRVYRLEIRRIARVPHPCEGPGDDPNEPPP